MKHEIDAARREVLETIPKDRRSFDTFLTKLLRPLFVLLPREVQLRLAMDTMNDITAAHVLAKERFGPGGNARVDGNECQLGVVDEHGDFAIVARGPSWDMAWASLDRRPQNITEACLHLGPCPSGCECWCDACESRRSAKKA